ncbi:hypothetical protein SAMN04490356_5155 [Streptomyces melanosporofaciens]|uniref:Uncharacterized protein n=2 Tax=Streptomyces melanosporofaciens TaxID=67327 RepID=A0A1H4UNG1_STRMJ|nr:hypothetical protein SAMN04490356_5155 [Streptomyces melanosporofaciens]
MESTGEIVHRKFRPTLGRLAALVCTSVIAVTGCGGDDGESGAPKPTSKPTAGAGLIPVAQACDGLFDEAIAKEAREPNGPSKVYPVKTESTGQVAKALREEPARRGTPEDLCTLTDKAEGKELLAITVAWTPHSPPSGQSVHYTTTVGPEDAGRLRVTCDLGSGSGSGTESGGARFLEFALRDYFTVSDHSHAKLLIASAKKITSQLDCRETPEYPDPKDVAPPPKPGLR